MYEYTITLRIIASEDNVLMGSIRKTKRISEKFVQSVIRDLSVVLMGEKAVEITEITRKKV